MNFLSKKKKPILMFLKAKYLRFQYFKLKMIDIVRLFQKIKFTNDC